MTLEDVVIGLMFLAVMFLAGLALIAMNAYACGSAWAGSGMATKYGPMMGCQIQLKDGTWIPADRYRQVQ